jgi:hypothetical protein
MEAEEEEERRRRRRRRGRRRTPGIWLTVAMKVYGT